MPRVVALVTGRTPAPRVTYYLEKVTAGFVVVDDGGDAWSSAYQSETLALRELRRLRRLRAAFEYAEDRLGRIEQALVEQHFVPDAAAARRILEDVLA